MVRVAVSPGRCNWTGPPGFLSCRLESSEELRLGRWNEAVVERLLCRFSSLMAWTSLFESRQLQPRELEEDVGAIDLGFGGKEMSSSSRACMRFEPALSLMKEAWGKRNSGDDGPDWTEAEGALPYMLDAVVLRLGAGLFLENSFSSLSNPLAMVGGPRKGASCVIYPVSCFQCSCI